MTLWYPLEVEEDGDNYDWMAVTPMVDFRGGDPLTVLVGNRCESTPEGLFISDRLRTKCANADRELGLLVTDDFKSVMEQARDGAIFGHVLPPRPCLTEACAGAMYPRGPVEMVSRETATSALGERRGYPATLHVCGTCDRRAYLPTPEQD